ncbi:MAG: DUF3098 domain-containing protein [Bacteroidales bacterium]|nr:DUF3098 domain-containing protein [Bacteroidales bacterium]
MSNNKFALSPKSVRFIVVGLIVMISGYILMIGGGSDDPNVFNPEMFNFTRLVVSPLLILLGVAIIIIAIMKKPKGDDEAQN